jgi:hypothetical protein
MKWVGDEKCIKSISQQILKEEMAWGNLPYMAGQ